MPRGLADWRDFVPPPHRTVHAVRPHSNTRLASNLLMARRLPGLNTGLDVGDRLADMRAPCLVSCRTRTRGSRRTTAGIRRADPGAQPLERP